LQDDKAIAWGSFYGAGNRMGRAARRAQRQPDKAKNRPTASGTSKQTQKSLDETQRRLLKSDLNFPETRVKVVRFKVYR
jgi:hypothetical protein